MRPCEHALVQIVLSKVQIVLLESSLLTHIIDRLAMQCSPDVLQILQADIHAWFVTRVIRWREAWDCAWCVVVVICSTSSDALAAHDEVARLEATLAWRARDLAIRARRARTMSVRRTWAAVISIVSVAVWKWMGAGARDAAGHVLRAVEPAFVSEVE